MIALYNDNYQARFLSPLGLIGIRLENDALATLDFLAPGREQFPVTSLACQAVRALRAYFADSRTPLDLPLACQGTDFQRRVWDALRSIPVGQTLTYGALAQQLGTAARAVGGACRANPIPIVVPCHRVVASNGLGGYCGTAQPGRLAIKHWLLVHEGGLTQ